MSKTLQELQRDNRRLKNEAESRKELVKIGQERVKLAEENRRLLIALRRSPTGVAIRKTLGVTGRGLFKAGKSIGKNLVRYGNFLAEQEIKNQRRERNIRTRTPKKRSVSRRRK